MQPRIKRALKSVIPYGAYAPLQDIFRFANSLRFLGEGFRCPFCEGQFSKFFGTGIDVPILKELHVAGAGYRANSVCPRCHSEDRERLILLFLEKRKAHIFRTAVRLLHVAPERNLSRKLRRFKNIEYLAGDLNSPMADVRMDITSIRKEDDAFDVIISNHVLEHIPDDRRAMRELFRVLSPGGFAILQVPIALGEVTTREDPLISDPAEQLRRFGQFDHVRIYGSDYTHRLEEAGFSAATFAPQDFLERENMVRYGLAPDEPIFVCSKPGANESSNVSSDF